MLLDILKHLIYPRLTNLYNCKCRVKLSRQIFLPFFDVFKNRLFCDRTRIIYSYYFFFKSSYYRHKILKMIRKYRNSMQQWTILWLLLVCVSPFILMYGIVFKNAYFISRIKLLTKHVLLLLYVLLNFRNNMKVYEYNIFKFFMSITFLKLKSLIQCLRLSSR